MVHVVRFLAHLLTFCQSKKHQSNFRDSKRPEKKFFCRKVGFRDANRMILRGRYARLI